MALPLGGKPLARKKLNVVSLLLTLFVPWLVFCSLVAMTSFGWHQTYPARCNLITIAVFLFFAIPCVRMLVNNCRRRLSGEAPEREEQNWRFLLYTSAAIAVLIAEGFGNHNFYVNVQPYNDLVSLNNYTGIDVAKMRGQEFLDAGIVTFVEGTHLDTQRSIGFKNKDTYCVAPITGMQKQGDPPLAIYDFWAVGKNCCTGAPGKKNEFACGAFDTGAHGGIRVVNEEERDFYRLAVQEAMSTHAVKAVHPLFFYWEDTGSDAGSGSYKIELNLKKDGFKYMLCGMLGFFAAQSILVGVVASCYAKPYWFLNDL